MKILYKMLVMLGLCAVLSPLAHTSENILDIFERTGVVPEISGGTSGVQYPPPSTGRLGPSNAFDRVTYSSSDNDRWLGDMSKDTFLQIGMPDDSAGYLITLLSYRLHRLSTGWNAWERSPTAWNLYGLDAAGEWRLLDERSGVVWDKTLTQETANQSFEVQFPAACSAFKFVPSASNHSGEQWTVGLMELELLGAYTPLSGSVLFVESNVEGVCESTPEWGVYDGIGKDAPVECTAADSVKDGIHYSCTGYVLETLDSVGNAVSAVTNMGSAVCTYSASNGVQRLTWLYEADGCTLDTAGYREGDYVELSVEPDLSLGCYSFGREVTVTAVSASGTFRRWHGDFGGAENVPETVVTMDRPRFIRFTSGWVYSDGSISDGNWSFTATGSAEALTLSALESVREGIFLDLGVPVMDASGGTVYSIVSLKDRLCKDLASLKEVFLPSGLTTVGSSAFSGCTSLEKVAPFLPETVTSVGASAFNGCVKLSGDLVFSNPEFKAIEPCVFRSTGITSVDMGQCGSVSMKNTGLGSLNEAFYGCVSLTNVVLSPEMQNIGYSAFSGCTSLERVTPFLPDSVSYVSRNAFSGCVKLKGDLVLSNPEFKTLESWAFRMTGITSADMGRTGLTSMQNTAIGNCNEAFTRCGALTNVVLSSTVQNIGLGAFSNCTNLQSVTPFLPDTVTVVGRDAFSGCVKLKGDLVLSNPGFKTLESYVFNLTGITSADMGGTSLSAMNNNGLFNSNRGFFGCGALTNVVLPQTVRQIGVETFSTCTNLETIVPFLPNSVADIGNYAFYNCRKLTQKLVLSCPDLTILRHRIFAYTNIGEVDMSRAGVKSMGLGEYYMNWSFAWNTSLTNVFMPAGIPEFGKGMFEKCTSLESVYFRGNAPQKTPDTFVASVPAYTARFYLPSKNKSWGAFASTNFVALTDAERADYQQRYPGEQEAFATWQIKSCNKQWACWWVPPEDERNTWMLIVK